MANLLDELACVHEQLAALHTAPTDTAHRSTSIDNIFTRTIVLADAFRTQLAETTLPLRKSTRQNTRSLQTALLSLAQEMLAGLPPPGTAASAPQKLWQITRTLALHLLISDLAATPSDAGVWLLLHKTFNLARQYKATEHTPFGQTTNLEELYYAALLLGCAQPTAFTAREINFIADFLERFSGLIETRSFHDGNNIADFWVNANSDAPATACIRKKAPQDTEILYFSCLRITNLLQEQLTALKPEKTACPKEALPPPAFAHTSTERGVMRRLITHWAHPAKRRFPRRRQSYKALLCIGIDNVWKLFHQNQDSHSKIDTSHWMTINESPDGYAIMHIAGKTRQLSAGDIVAIRNEDAQNWQTCIVRWISSENNEHLELGIQILATRAIAAELASPLPPTSPACIPALILPELPGVQPLPRLITPASTLPPNPKDFVLLVEQQNLAIREIRSAQLIEQNSLVDIFTIPTSNSENSPG